MITQVREIVMPQLGANEETAIVVEWLVSEGSAVSKGDRLATLETNKATIELECEESGFFYPLAKRGESRAVQDVIAIVLSHADEKIARDHAERLAVPAADSGGNA